MRKGINQEAYNAPDEGTIDAYKLQVLAHFQFQFFTQVFTFPVAHRLADERTQATPVFQYNFISILSYPCIDLLFEGFIMFKSVCYIIYRFADMSLAS